MKKTKIILGLLSLMIVSSTLVLNPHFFSASVFDNVLSSRKPDYMPSFEADNAEDQAFSFIFGTIDVILLVAGILAVFFLVLGGFRMVVGSASQDETDSAKKTIYWALLGLGAVILAWALVTNFVKVLVIDDSNLNGAVCKDIGEVCFFDSDCCTNNCGDGSSGLLEHCANVGE